MALNTKLQEQHRFMSVFLLQVCESPVKTGTDGFRSGAVRPVGRLEQVEGDSQSGDDVLFTVLSKHIQKVKESDCWDDGAIESMMALCLEPAR